MLTRYTVLQSFTLDGNAFIEGSTFLDDDELTGELLCKTGFLTPKPKFSTLVTIIDDPYKKKNYLSQMNKKELLTVAANENIQIDPNANTTTIRAQIKRTRALRGESTR